MNPGRDRIKEKFILLGQKTLRKTHKHYIMKNKRDNKSRVFCRGCSPAKKGYVIVFINGSVNVSAVWLIIMIILLIIEGVVPGLVSIWFALGALGALLAAIVGAPVWLQIVWFFVISLVCLWLTRPLAKKYVNSRAVPTNADMLIGKECVVTEGIDNVLGLGAVTVGGKIWTARTEDPEVKAEVGQTMTVLRIEGVKLIVK